MKYTTKKNIFSFLFTLFLIPGFAQSNTDSIAVNDTTGRDSTVVYADTIISGDAIKKIVNAKATDSLVIVPGENKAFLYREAIIDYDQLKLTAGKISIDFKESLLSADPRIDSAGKEEGLPNFTKDATDYRAARIRYNFKTEKGKLYELKTKLNQGGEAYLHGEVVKKDQYDVMYVADAKFTTCDLDDPHYYIASNKIKRVPDENIIAGRTYLVISDVPTPIMAPFGFFPDNKERSSGFVLPEYGENNQWGFYLRDGGWYFGLSDKYDLTLTGAIYTNGSWRLNAVTRYANRYRFYGNLDLQYGKTLTGEREDPDFKEEREYRIQWNHFQDRKARPNAQFSGSIDIANRNTLRNTSNEINNLVGNDLSSSISYSRQFSNTPLSLSLAARHSQNLNTGIMQFTLPDANFQVRKITPFRRSKTGLINKLNFSYNLKYKNVYETSDSLLFNEFIRDNFRSGFSYNLPIATTAKVLKYFTITPSFNYNGKVYFDRVIREYDRELDTVLTTREDGFYNTHEYSFSTTLNTRIYGLLNVNRGGIIAFRHVLNPQININYRPDFSEGRYNYYDKYWNPQTEKFQKYSYFSGNVFGAPSSGENGLLGVNLNNNLEMKVRSKNDSTSGTKKIQILDNFGLSGNYNFLADSFGLSRINLYARTTLLETFTIQFEGLLDPYMVDQKSRRRDELLINTSGKPGEFDNLNLAINFSLRPEMFKGKKTGSMEKEEVVYGPTYNRYSRQEYPWSLSVGYIINYNFNRTSLDIAPQLRQTLELNGDLKVTEKWSVGFRTGYDLSAEEFTLSKIDIKRDLHCWEMRIDWVPFGSRKYYGFQINVKSQILKDLKYDKRQEQYR